jgi:hypothetical protein
MKRRSRRTALAVIAAIASLFTTSCGFYEMSAGELYEDCSVALHVPDKDKSSEQKIKAARCEKFAQRVFYENGYVYVGDEKDPKIQELKNYCPAFWTAPMGGPYVYLVQYWDKHGMSSFGKNFVSAESAAKSVFKKLFPKCAEKRATAGVPKVTKY